MSKYKVYQIYNKNWNKFLNLPIGISSRVILSSLSRPFAETPRIAQGFGSGLQLRTAHEPSYFVILRERKQPKNLIPFLSFLYNTCNKRFLRVFTPRNDKKGRRPFGFASGWQKEGIPSLCSGSGWQIKRRGQVKKGWQKSHS